MAPTYTYVNYMLIAKMTSYCEKKNNTHTVADFLFLLSSRSYLICMCLNTESKAYMGIILGAKQMK